MNAKPEVPDGQSEEPKSDKLATVIAWTTLFANISVIIASVATYVAAFVTIQMLMN